MSLEKVFSRRPIRTAGEDSFSRGCIMGGGYKLRRHPLSASVRRRDAKPECKLHPESRCVCNAVVVLRSISNRIFIDSSTVTILSYKCVENEGAGI